MKVILALVGRNGRNEIFDPPFHRYLHRTSAYVEIEAQEFRTEQAFFDKVRREQGRTAPWSALLDQRGSPFTSEEFAARLGRLRDAGRQKVFLAVGPASGWSQEAADQAQALLSLGRITLPHELAAVVLAEQVYRAFTILAGHPYHLGH